MSTTWLPCGDYHQNYVKDHAWFQTKFIKGKMILLALLLFVFIPLFADEYWLSVCNTIGYTILGALGSTAFNRLLRPGHPGSCGISCGGSLHQHLAYP